MKAVVIGGGIMGLSSAYYLVKDGWDVTIIDRSDLADNCSYGNLGMIVPSHFVPLAAPGMVAQGIRWMFSNKSPFYVKPSFDLNLMKWGLSFMKSATQKHVDRSAKYLLDINLFSKSLYEDMALSPDFNFHMEKKGIMMYYKTEKTGEEERHLAEKGRSMGIDVEALTSAQVQELEPDIKFNIAGAVHYRCDAHLYPNALIQQLIKYLRNAGVQFSLKSEVKKIVKDHHRVKNVVTSTGEVAADIVVIAAGSWLPELAKLAGESVSLMPGKGYSFTLDHPDQKLNIPAILCEARVAITPMNGKMRYGGTMEIGKVNDQINLNRVKGIVESISTIFSKYSIINAG